MVQKGFTLIELLVVVSIISLMSSIVLGSFKTPRMNAENVKMGSLVHNYEFALESYYNDHGVYPDPLTNLGVCLGDYPTNTCWEGVVSENAALNAALAPYYPGTPPNDIVVPYFDFSAGTTREFTGLIYSCYGQAYPSAGRCKEYRIYWMEKGEGQKCPGDIPYKSQGGITQCQVPSYP
jgi:prepilin-type N-terminal cleavage/methylation domain-containing protein